MRKANIRLLGSLVALFASAHLYLNIYVVISRFIVPGGIMKELMHALSGAFGPIAIQEDMNPLILSVKITASSLFVMSGFGVIGLKEWARKLLFALLGLRIAYGCVICAAYRVLHPHLWLIIAEGAILYYYLGRRDAAERFAGR
jgi:hypothetical protein